MLKQSYRLTEFFCCISAVEILLFLQKEKIFNAYFSVHFETIAYKGNAIDFLLTFSCDLRKTIGRDTTPKSQKRHHQIFHRRTKRYRQLLLLIVDLPFTSWTLCLYSHLSKTWWRRWRREYQIMVSTLIVYFNGMSKSAGFFLPRKRTNYSKALANYDCPTIFAWISRENWVKLWGGQLAFGGCVWPLTKAYYHTVGPCGYVWSSCYTTGVPKPHEREI